MFQSNCDINYSLRKLIIFIQNNTHTYRKKNEGGSQDWQYYCMKLYRYNYYYISLIKVF